MKGVSTWKKNVRNFFNTNYSVFFFIIWKENFWKQIRKSFWHWTVKFFWSKKDYVCCVADNWAFDGLLHCWTEKEKKQKNKHHERSNWFSRTMFGFSFWSNHSSSYFDFSVMMFWNGGNISVVGCAIFACEKFHVQTILSNSSDNRFRFNIIFLFFRVVLQQTKSFLSCSSIEIPNTLYHP